MMEEAKIGFIGCGGNASGHMNTLENIDGARIVATCDIDENRANAAAQKHNANPYTDHRSMLERADLDAIYLSLPVFAHGQPELDVIDRGLPFLVEKPVAIEMDIAHQVEEAVRKADLITCVGYQLRYLGATKFARQILAKNDVSMGIGKYWSGTGRGNPDAWIRQMNKSGGQLLEQATHTIDMMRYLLGEVEEVHAMQTSRVLTEIDCPDSNIVSLKFENGAVGSLTAYWAFDNGDWSHTNVVDVLYKDQLINWNPSRLRIKENGEYVDKTEASPSIDEVFVGAVRSGNRSQILSPYADAVKTMAVSIAANQSGCTGKSIKISNLSN
ncbi:TPA: Gfo/Idh/MocA family oxidoreductase [Candidatus Poribacteria bacterium]|jgi:predicted dehydrogenase|nr:Gfo/Idh/MocA family oxidoreductase [Candidatus Poribacteria bacterium]HIB86269.1 Gfo/Idh/MocA family oxidoreductase [Candidatus Poribacteria bacterium]HIB98951.1 Gfo/Idh/MocA family oxidoreductase [Candidatus Poribacteria bacterium]HIM10231.1 Gfo/Idh/MocA family oxidoreductase [Candidatus Poribacteria bacterium]HIN27848.1 Gfo/Idh/MocA family oxidoreductase [Candidatus Poribacteria bacterium]